jgi:hypothetical protein
MKLLKLGKISLDGTKGHANASKHHALSWGHAHKIEKQLRAEVRQLLQMAEEADAADLPDGMDLPDELARREDRLAALLKELGKVKALAADSGYFSSDNAELCEEKRITPYLANRRQQHHPSLRSRFSGTPPLPANGDAVETMKW